MADCKGEPMGFFRPEWGGTGDAGTAKRKFRWLFDIENITLGNDTALPCIKAARPKLTFKEMQAEHLNETISYPSKPEWQPIQLSLYDRCINVQNPIFTWLKKQYNPVPTDDDELPGCSDWFPCIDPLSFKVCCTLKLLDGCGNKLEEWTLEHCYPQNIDWGDLDMSSSEIVTVDFSLRYDRAFQTFPSKDHKLYTKTECASCTDPKDCGDDSEGTLAINSMNITAMLRNATSMSVTVQNNLGNIKLNEPDFVMII
jgi:hypothetical protein